MKKIITLLFLLFGLITLSPATIIDMVYGTYFIGQVNQSNWWEGYVGISLQNNNTVIIDGETIAHSGTATYVYVNINNGAATNTETGNPAIGSSWTSYTIYYSPGWLISSSAYHEIIDNQYGNVSCSTSVSGQLY